MKLISFLASDTTPRLGVVLDDRVVDLTRWLHDCPADMQGLIKTWDEQLPRIQELLATRTSDWALSEVKLMAPVPRPGKIMGIGLNYADHIAESGFPKPELQVWFSKAVTSVNGPYDPVVRPLVSVALDYEAELAFIVGKRCRHVSREQAASVIFGYVVANDVSVRDWQLNTSQFVLGKSFDTTAPFGPWIVTSDELTAPLHLDIRTLVNGELRQSSNTRELIFDCLDQVVHLSKAMTLEPGDVILTGTPGGVGAGFKPPRFLQPGDVVRVEIDGVGAIENRIVDEASLAV